MNKKEITEIKKNFSDDCGYFTMNHVVTAFVDSEKNIKCKTNNLYCTLPSDEAELIMINLKKVLSGQIGRNQLEYHFPKEAYMEDGSQKFLYEVLQSRFTDSEITDKFLNAIVEKMEYVSTYAIFAAHCTYSVLKKNKNDDLEDDTELDYNFIITAICPVNLRIDGLVYNEATNEIAKKANGDRIVELPSDGFLFPLFNDRSPDVNGVMYYTKDAKKPNTSIVDNLLGCEFVMSCQSEKATFQAILNNVVADELDYSMITTVNEKIQEIVDQNSHETEIPTIDKNKLSSILWESGVSQEKLEHLPKVYENAMGDKSLKAVNLLERKTVLSVPSITVNISKEAVDKVRTEIIDGKKCLIIDLDDPEISVNGISATIE